MLKCHNIPIRKVKEFDYPLLGDEIGPENQQNIWDLKGLAKKCSDIIEVSVIERALLYRLVNDSRGRWWSHCHRTQTTSIPSTTADQLHLVIPYCALSLSETTTNQHKKKKNKNQLLCEHNNNNQKNHKTLRKAYLYER